MSTKGDSNMEPMRKRSSSANEASKPINVLHRRQNHPETKPNYSPQTIIYYGRERCDSLPSRNRTSSECSNQSFSTSSSILSIRNSTISGLRPHSYQRHSSSPPMNSIIGCSESEESSISIDDPDDNGSYLSYRFNSRSSEGVIPEENTDELINSENKWNDSSNNKELDNNLFEVPAEKEDNYVSMAPLKNTTNLDDINQSNHCKLINNIDDSKCVPFSSPLNLGSPKSSIEFPEYSSDNAEKNLIIEVDSQTDRPIRAYSIGSKIEHTKINKRIGTNASEVDLNSMTRVRAFSVGSRAKIPRCDLQRGILFPKAMFEPSYNSNSNNNICCFSDTMTYNQLLNINASCRDKKSTSAPLLIHKSHNSVDRMGDLMEIDFSKVATSSNNRIHQTKSQFSKSVPSAAREHIPIRELGTITTTKTYVNRGDNSIHECQTSKIPMITSTPSKLIATTDNGYLEMKPVGSNIQIQCEPIIMSVPAQRNVSKTETIDPIPNEYLKMKPKNFEISNVPENSNHCALNTSSTVLAYGNESKKVIKLLPISSTLHENNTKYGHGAMFSSPSTSTSLRQYKDGRSENNSLVENNLLLRNIKSTSTEHLNSSDNLHTLKLSSKYSQLTLSPVSSYKKSNVNTRKDDYINIDEKCDKTNNGTSNNTNTKSRKNESHDSMKESYVTTLNETQKECKNVLFKEAGYEILQIKSDSSLQSHKLLSRPTAVRKEKQQNQLIQSSRCRPISNMSLISSVSQSAAVMTTSPMLGTHSSSSTSCLNYMPIQQQAPSAIMKDLSCSNNVLSTSTPSAKIHHNCTSRPPSITSEHELYYASLDLPQSSSEVNPKIIKTETSNDSSSSIAMSHVNNSYAKIDFDVSDLSSPSLKNLNI